MLSNGTSSNRYVFRCANCKSLIENYNNLKIVFTAEAGTFLTNNNADLKFNAVLACPYCSSTKFDLFVSEVGVDNNSVSSLKSDTIDVADLGDESPVESKEDEAIIINVPKKKPKKNKPVNKKNSSPKPKPSPKSTIVKCSGCGKKVVLEGTVDGSFGTKCPECLSKLVERRRGG
ncbi:MAG: hypothetical protein DRP85_00705 [Candidatus Makaraimicrobium thalassicum]|nr:MAG: hypothetical protein DRP85_00705 [Candidatus Omnitrophota bacterium]